MVTVKTVKKLSSKLLVYANEAVMIISVEGWSFVGNVTDITAHNVRQGRRVIQPGNPGGAKVKRTKRYTISKTGILR